MKEFYKKLISSNSDTSSKRFSGIIGFAIFIILVIFVLTFDFFTEKSIGDNTTELIQTLGILSAGLLGLGLIDRSKLMK